MQRYRICGSLHSPQMRGRRRRGWEFFIPLGRGMPGRRGGKSLFPSCRGVPEGRGELFSFPSCRGVPEGRGELFSFPSCRGVPEGRGELFNFTFNSDRLKSDSVTNEVSRTIFKNLDSVKKSHGKKITIFNS